MNPIMRPVGRNTSGPPREVHLRWNEVLPPDAEPDTNSSRMLNALCRRDIDPRFALAAWESSFLKFDGVGAQAEAWFVSIVPVLRRRLAHFVEQTDCEYREAIEFAFGAV